MKVEQIRLFKDHQLLNFNRLDPFDKTQFFKNWSSEARRNPNKKGGELNNAIRKIK